MSWPLDSALSKIFCSATFCFPSSAHLVLGSANDPTYVYSGGFSLTSVDCAPAGVAVPSAQVNTTPREAAAIFFFMSGPRNVDCRCDGEQLNYASGRRIRGQLYLLQRNSRRCPFFNPSAAAKGPRTCSHRCGHPHPGSCGRT